jgi:hypothetical protein
LSKQISGIRAAHASRPDYLRVVAEPGPVTPATPCPPWCTVPHIDPIDRFHYSEPVDVGDIRMFAEIRDDGSPAVNVHGNGGEGDFLTLPEVDELIAKLAAMRALLAGTQVAA